MDEIETLRLRQRDAVRHGRMKFAVELGQKIERRKNDGKKSEMV